VRRWRILIIAAGMSLAATTAAVPTASAETEKGEDAGILAAPQCVFGNTWVVTGNWDGIGGDGIGIVVDNGSVLTWYLRNGPNAGPADFIFQFGSSGDHPVVGNWDGVGGDGPGIVRVTSTSEWRWLLRNGPNTGVVDYDFVYGRTSYVPLTGNWDGVGGDGPGVAGGDASGYKAWHLRNGPNAGSADYDFTYGLTGASDWPTAGNWDGVGGDGPGITRGVGVGLQWHERFGPNSGPADYTFNYGVAATDCGVVGNWDGVGGDGPGIVRYNSSTGKLQWHLRNGNNTGPAEYVFDYS
jgi:hypothetical protein